VVVHREDVKEEEDELEQTGEDGEEEAVLARVESVNEQENEIEQMGEAECVEETACTSGVS